MGMIKESDRDMPIQHVDKEKLRHITLQTVDVSRPLYSLGTEIATLKRIVSDRALFQIDQSKDISDPARTGTSHSEEAPQKRMLSRPEKKRILVINRLQNRLITERSVDLHAQIQKANSRHRGSRRR